MADKLTPDRRSWNMSRIRGKDTKPEKLVRSLLFRAGYRFRKNDPRLPGKPDIVLPKYKIAVFVHGCFWHGHGCKISVTPKTNTEFWADKIGKNQARDQVNISKLEALGWKTILIWECEITEGTQKLLQHLEKRRF
ncbi:MAG: DNA mismatch endonuclease Vsr [Blastochloris viridis]|uniref:Very short patch repair endonuclease n=1 Tax=Blastochloris viridis TaxID=1079 RepID=A0A6N4R2U0_BLAVI|nr:MAG: DNA mismatch endonuclease Vsr [Blastochloris viridis]